MGFDYWNFFSIFAQICQDAAESKVRTPSWGLLFEKYSLKEKVRHISSKSNLKASATVSDDRRQRKLSLEKTFILW